MAEPAGLGPGPTIIQPIDFRTRKHRRAPGRSIGRRLVLLLVLALVGVATVCGWFAFTARRIELTFDPEPDRYELTGPPLRFELGGRHVLRPGAYTVSAFLEGYHPLRETFDVGAGENDAFHFTLTELEGFVSFRCVGTNDLDAALADVEVHVDGRRRGATPLDEVELAPGPHTVTLAHDRYRDLEVPFLVEGRARRQTETFELRPDWAEVDIESSPEGAEILVDGFPVSTAPCRIEIESGPHTVELTAPGYDPWRRELTIVPEQPVALTGIVLERTKGRVRVETDPPGAQVMIDAAYAGLSPIEVEVPPDRDLNVQVVRDGYEPARTTVRVASSATETVNLALEPRMGVVRLEVSPPGTTLLVDGTEIGPAPEEIALTAESHRLEFRREGYVPQVHTVRPRPGVPERVRASLAPVEAKVTAEDVGVQPRTAANGYPLVLARPGTFVMGSSRREQGRRTNETLRTIALDRPFLFGTREVTNAEFAAFRSDHQSGLAGTIPLSGKERPVVQVTWDDAARYCNWLSRQDGLPPAYVEVQGAMQAVDPMTTGYRMPTEAEWEYVARVDGSGQLLKYPWGMRFPPRGKAGNYADESSRPTLAMTVPGYDDGFPGPAPAASFAPNAAGLYDLGGNAAEWCHDFYTTYTYNADRVVVDPLGPKQGRHHVVKGSSWRHASVGDLRFARRDYSDDKRDDLGIRICRYLETREPRDEK